MVQLTDEDIIALKGLAAVAPKLQTLLAAPRADADDHEDTDAWLKRKIAEPTQRGGNHFDNLQVRIENAWRK